MKKSLSLFAFCIMVIGSFSSTAYAIPSSGVYTVNSTILSGEFQSNGNALVTWDFTPISFSSTNFSDLTSPADMNSPTEFLTTIGIERIRITWGAGDGGPHTIEYQKISTDV